MPRHQKRYPRNSKSDRRFWDRLPACAIGTVDSARYLHQQDVPAPCDHEVFEHGEPVVILDAASADAERWVQLIAKHAKARVDWHYSGGRAQVIHLGDADSRARVMTEIEEHEPDLKGAIIKIVLPGDTGLYRAGVTPVPEGAIAVDPDLGPIVSEEPPTGCDDNL